MSKLRIAIIYGSVRHNRKGIRAVRFLENKCRERKWDITTIDPMETPLPLLDKMFKEYEEGAAPENMEMIGQILRDSEGYIIVTGEYNHSIPPALKNLLDHYQQEYHYKPSGIAAYSAGHFGGARSAVHLRAILGELGTVSIPRILYFPSIGQSVSEDGKADNDRIRNSADRFLDEFEWYVHALRSAREAGTP